MNFDTESLQLKITSGDTFDRIRTLNFVKFVRLLLSVKQTLG